MRRTAADALSEMGTPGAVAALRRLYYEDEAGARSLAMSALVRTRDKTALAIYLEAIASSDPFFRSVAARGLGALGAPVARDPLRAVLRRESDPIVRNRVACALALLGEREGLAYLEQGLRDEREYVRDLVVGLLGLLDLPEVAPLLRAALSDVSENVRVTAAASLTRFKDASGLPAVREALVHPDFRVRLGAAVSFSRMDYETARRLILAALESGDPLVRTHALKAIGENHDRSARPVVIDAVEREADSYTRAQGAWTLGQLGGRRTIPMLLDLLGQERPEIRHAAAEALVTIADRVLGAAGGAD
jgi:HEAT repeat protein